MARSLFKLVAVLVWFAALPVLAEHIPGMPRWTGHEQPAGEVAARASPVLPLIPQANQGNANAAYRLARLYDEGSEVSRNRELAAGWYYQAAIKGHPLAQHRLGQMYERGIGVERDYPKAVRWYQLASIEGLESAEAELTRLLRPRATRIGAQRAYIRGAPGGLPDTGVLMEVHAGEELYVFRDGEDWLEVYLPMADLWGWLRASALQADPSLFGERLTVTDRQRMRARLAEKGLREVAAIDQPWVDVYASAPVLAWSEQLTLGYVPRDGRLAFAEYHFPARTSVSGLNTLQAVRELVTGKYGHPLRVPATRAPGWQEFQWERGTIVIRVAGMPGGPVILAYEQPEALLLLEEDLENYRRYRRIERAAAEGDAY